MAFDSTAMDEAGRKAHEELKVALEALTPTERVGAEAIFAWLKAHYRAAGYKRLCRPLVRG